MELPSSSLILKISLLSVLTITANAVSKPTNSTNNKLIPLICRKTKNPGTCFNILRFDPKARLASSLHELGELSLEGAISQAKSSVNVFNQSLKRKDLPVKVGEKFKDCRDNYEMAMKKLLESKTAWNKKDYALARKSLEVACHVPPPCEKEIGGAERSIALRKVNKMSDIHFDIPLVIVKEMESEISN